MNIRVVVGCLALAATVTSMAQDQPAKPSSVERLMTVIDEHGLDAALHIPLVALVLHTTDTVLRRSASARTGCHSSQRLGADQVGIRH